MHNTPSEGRSQVNSVTSRSAVSRFVSNNLAWMIAGTGLMTTAAINGCGKVELSHAPHLVPVKAPALADDVETDTVNPVSALAVENAVRDTKENVIAVQPVSFVSTVPQKKTEMKKGPVTLEELADGEIPHGTQIKLMDQNGDSFILIIEEGGDILNIDGQRFEQTATASKKTGLFTVPLGEYPITWKQVERATVEGRPVFVIHGRQKNADASEPDEVSQREQSDLATLCRNVKAAGQFEFALPKKTVTGIGEVSLIGKVKKAAKTK